mmetsp:Transcript_72363/g.182547  ORF Transcript_72363/g.182547 Transcript_72363/m.182547 type:complete len:97 (-) Transcript_72363:858-1148(-)
MVFCEDDDDADAEAARLGASAVAEQPPKTECMGLRSFWSNLLSLSLLALLSVLGVPPPGVCPPLAPSWSTAQSPSSERRKLGSGGAARLHRATLKQ